MVAVHFKHDSFWIIGSGDGRIGEHLVWGDFNLYKHCI